MRTTYPRSLTQALYAFGFDRKETQVYLAGLELGASTVLELSRRTRLARTTLYPILEDLRNRGYFRLGKQRRGSVYTAEAPMLLEQRLRERAQQLTGVLPQLNALRGTVHEGAGVTLYEGSDGFRQLWQRIFHSGVKEYRIMTSGVGLLEFVKEPYLVERIIAERIRRGIRSKQLITDSLIARKIIAKDVEELRESRMLPRGSVLPATLIIFGGEVAFITTRRENAMVLVASGDAAVSLQTLFSLLWEHAATVV
ncbi:MAG: helix-turn-helix domain-containing protein [bacterium]|nr:helix-turn-helix domain-containing protein [bacterium]